MTATAPIAEEVPASRRIPLVLKFAYTAFLAILVPVYWRNYGPTNFLYFCDAALFLTLYAVWAESALAASMAAVGILLPQAFWCLDFAVQIFHPHPGMTAYMFDEKRSLFLRGLSSFHGWLPFLLVFLVARLGYDRRAFLRWFVLAVVLCFVSFLFLPPAGAQLPNPQIPVNVNYVFGLDDGAPQKWVSADLYVVIWLCALTLLAYVPTHLLLRKFAPQPRPKDLHRAQSLLAPERVSD